MAAVTLGSHTAWGWLVMGGSSFGVSSSSSIGTAGGSLGPGASAWTSRVS